MQYAGVGGLILHQAACDDDVASEYGGLGHIEGLAIWPFYMGKGSSVRRTAPYIGPDDADVGFNNNLGYMMLLPS